MRSRRYVLVTGGSLGDVIPYVALAKRLQVAGEQVVLLADEPVRLLARSERVPFEATGQAPPAGSGFGEQGGWSAVLRLTRSWVVDALPSAVRSLQAVLRRGDVVVAHPIQIAAPLVARARGLPWWTVSPALWLFRNEQRMPLYHPVRSLGAQLNRAAWTQFSRALDRRFLPDVRSVCSAAGLPQPDEPFLDLCCSPTGTLALTSPLLLDGRRLPPSVTATGLVEGDAVRTWRNRARLDRFLEPGGTVLAFRAPPHQPSDGLQEACSAICRERGVRGIYLDFTAPQTGVRGPLLIDRYIPLSVLLQHCVAGVHYGGLGTTTAFAAHGRPAVIMPSTVDQFENADVIGRLRAGVRLDWRRWNPKRLHRAIDHALDLQPSSRDLGKQLGRERGLEAAVDRLLTVG